MRTVLLVDDSPVARRALTQRLTSEGFEIAEASTVAAARKVDVFTLGCVIVDLELPDGDGTDLARHLAEKRPSLPIAFFTQGSAPSLVEGARGRGMGVDIAKAVRFQESLRIFALQSCDPNALGGANMRDGVAYRIEAVAHGTYELLGRDVSCGIEHPVARPIVIVDEELQIVVVHQVQFKA